VPNAPSLAWFFFSLSGRVSRSAYLLAGLLLAVIQAFLLYRYTLAPQDSSAGEGWAFAFWIAVVVSVWANFALSVKRLHDFGKPGLIAVTLFIPVVSIVAFVVLCLYPGDAGPNQYGQRTNAPR
jgi:uncharacterized membrane protein YhaH (DUF805 family)